MKRFHSIPWLLIVMVSLLSACAGIQQDYPAKRYYALNVPVAAGHAARTGKAVLQIAVFRASPQAQGRSLIYRISDERYESDYYNEFLVPPETMLADEARNFMDAQGIFKAVISKASLVFPDYVLEGNVVRMYGDYRNPRTPLAILELELFLLNTDTTQPRIVFHRNYVKETTLSKPAPSDLVAGYDQLAAQIFTEFANDIRQSGVLRGN